MQTCENSKRVVYIECTESYLLNLHTGIQRVVRNIVNNAYSMSEIPNYKFVPIVCVYSRFYELNTGFQKDLFFTRVAAVIFGTIRNLVDKIFKPGKSDMNITAGHASTAVSKKESFYFRFIDMCRNIMPLLFKLTLNIDNIKSDVREVAFKDGDILFISDVFWRSHIYNGAVNITNKKLIKILMVYDVIALSHPEFVDNMNVVDFEKFFYKYLDIIDGIVTISEYSVEQIKFYARSFKNNLEYNYFHLGADFNSYKKQECLVRDDLTKIFDNKSVYLAVGTVEPRKNYSFILDAFEQLWSSGIDLPICIVGRVGWKCEELMERISSLRKAGKNIYFFSDLNDAELEYCYQGAKALIFASVVEGFGLPLVEAMHFGKPVIASNIPVFREVGDDYPIYFDLKAPGTLAKAVTEFEFGNASADFAPRRWLSWDESVQELFSKIVLMAEDIKAKRSDTLT